MKRVLADAVVVVLLIGGDTAWRLGTESSSAAMKFVTLHMTLFWTMWVTLVAAARAVIGFVGSRGTQSIAIGLIEWLCTFICVHILLCWLDTVWHPQDNFTTVFAFTLLTQFVPSIVVSSIAYAVISSTLAKK